MLQAYLIALAGVAAAQAAPGPNMMAVAGAGLAQGRRTALFVVLGVGSGVLIWSAAVAFGLGALFSRLPLALTVLKLVGGLYLLFLALRAVTASLRGGAGSIRANTKIMGAGQAWRRGLLVVLTNPKAALMWGAVATFLFGSGLGVWQVLGFGPVAAASALLIYGTYGLLFSSGVATRVYARFTRAIEAILGASFGALGLSLLTSGAAELRKSL